MKKFWWGPPREELRHDQVQQLLPTGTLILDERRSRSAFFDGRFLTARDLTREQTYFLAREADLARIGGVGVAAGLTVEAAPEASAAAVRIGGGIGVTPAGETVALREEITVDLNKIAEIQRLGVLFGLSSIPNDPPWSRAGLFVLALRPVEYTANPIASYPTTLGGTRTQEYGDIVEATAVTLIPFPDLAGAGDLDERRAIAAHEIFVRGDLRVAPENVLPLAMIALADGALRWVDMFLVRREIGADATALLGLRHARAAREAHLLQYDRHLDEVLEDRKAAGMPQSFPASDHFRVLPPAGRLPEGAVQYDKALGAFTQVYFPPVVDVEMAVVPEDEIAALVEDSLRLPPIDLTLTTEELDATAVLVLLPASRTDPILRAASAGAGAAAARSVTRRLRSAVPGRRALPLPTGGMRALFAARAVEAAEAEAAVETVSDAAYRAAISGASQVWYVRRQNLAHKAEIVGEAMVRAPAPAVRAPARRPHERPAAPTRLAAGRADDLDGEGELRERLARLGREGDLGKLKARATAAAIDRMVTLLGAAPFASPLRLAGAIGELAGKDRLARADVLEVAERFEDADLDPGLAALAERGLDEPRAAAALARTALIPEVALVAASRDEATTGELIELIEALVASPSPEAEGRLATFVREALAKEDDTP